MAPLPTKALRLLLICGTTAPLAQVETPSFSLPAGSYDGTQSVELSCATAGASIYYTTDGSTPDSGDTLYSGAISVSASATVKAIAVKGGMLDSEIASAAYVIILNPATITPFAWYDPSDLSTLWQDTAGTTPVTADGQSVARIDDKSGNGRHLTDATGGRRPLYKTSGGLHWLLFDGTDDRMVMTGNPTTVVAIAVAVRVTSGLTGYRGIACTYDGSGTGSMMLARMTTNKWGTYGGTDQAANTSILDDGDHVLMMDGTTSGTFYLDGVSDGTYAATSGQDPASAGGISGQTTAMRLYGLVMRSSAFGADRAGVNTYLGFKQGRSI